MAKDLYNHDITEVWKNVKKNSQCSNIQDNPINGITHFGEIIIGPYLNSNECNKELKSSIMSKADGIQYNDHSRSQ